MTTLGIGGPARYYAEVATTNALIDGVEWAKSHDVPLFVVGGGSNIVVADAGFSGLVLRINIHGVETRIDGGDVLLEAGAGEEWDPLVAQSVANNWSGFECLSGIPGRVGATPIQNVGAYGQDISETLAMAEALDLSTGQLVELSAADCEFGYRTSRFKTRDRDRFVITRASYRLIAGGDAAVRYPELKRYLADCVVGTPTLSDVRQAVLSLRRRKAMVIDSSDIDSRSVGSFFVNPTVTAEQRERIDNLASRFMSGDETMPAFPGSDGMVKLSAAWLIERAGIERGYVHGNVGTSTKHALAIINRGGGTAREVVELKELIQKCVADKFGIDLTPEPVLVGFDQ